MNDDYRPLAGDHTDDDGQINDDLFEANPNRDYKDLDAIASPYIEATAPMELETKVPPTILSSRTILVAGNGATEYPVILVLPADPNRTRCELYVPDGSAYRVAVSHDASVHSMCAVLTPTQDRVNLEGHTGAIYVRYAGASAPSADVQICAVAVTH